jgi:hypothetical protein
MTTLLIVMAALMFLGAAAAISAVVRHPVGQVVALSVGLATFAGLMLVVASRTGAL